MDTYPIRVMSLFSGVSGLGLGVRIALPESRHVLFIERESYCCEVLAARMAEGSIDPAPIFTDITQFDGKPWRGRVDLIEGGSPCQDLSVAGKRAGISGKRSGLWGEYRRVIEEVQPAFVFFENVAGIVSSLTLLHRGEIMGHLEGLLSAAAAAEKPKDRWTIERHHERLYRRLLKAHGIPALLYVQCGLEALGYRCQTGFVTASETGAAHRRERVFILAHRPGATLAHKPGARRYRMAVAEVGRRGELREPSERNGLTHGSDATLADPARHERDRPYGEAGQGGEFAKQVTNWQTPTTINARDVDYTYPKGTDHSVKFPSLVRQAKDMDAWPTPNKSDDIAGSNTNHWQTPATDSFRSRGGDRKDEMGLDQQSRLWATPRTISGGAETAERKQELGRKDSGGGVLQAQTETWPTPTGSDYKGSGPTVIRKDGKDRSNDRLDYATDKWPTPTVALQEESRESWEARREREKAKGRNGNGMGEPLDMVATNYPFLRQDQEPAKPGKVCWCGLRGCALPGHRRKLNPYFGESLMGVPMNWTSATARIDSGQLETWFARSRQRLVSLCLREERG